MVRVVYVKTHDAMSDLLAIETSQNSERERGMYGMDTYNTFFTYKSRKYWTKINIETV